MHIDRVAADISQAAWCRVQGKRFLICIERARLGPKL